MQKLQLSIFALAVMALGLGSCSKECDVTPSSNEISSAEKGGTNGTVIPIGALSISVNDLNINYIGDEIVITGTRQSNSSGTFIIEEGTGVAPTTWIPVGSSSSTQTVSFSIAEAALTDHNRLFRARFIPDNGNNDFESPYIFLNVLDGSTTCTPFNLVASSQSVNFGTPTEFTTTYTIHNCGLAVQNIKLQGGLTNGANYVSSSNDLGLSPNVITTTQKGKDKNTIITFDNINMVNEVETFTITYSKNVPCGLNTVTGNWSAKGFDGLNNINTSSIADRQVIEVICN